MAKVNKKEKESGDMESDAQPVNNSPKELVKAPKKTKLKKEHKPLRKLQKFN